MNESLQHPTGDDEKIEWPELAALIGRKRPSTGVCDDDDGPRSRVLDVIICGDASIFVRIKGVGGGAD
jgi:hypothetical protein